MRCYRPGMPRYVPWHMRTEADATPDAGGAIAAMLAGAGRVGTAQMARAAAQRDAWMVPKEVQQQLESDDDAAASTSQSSPDKAGSGQSRAQPASSISTDEALATQLMLEFRADDFVMEGWAVHAILVKACEVASKRRPLLDHFSVRSERDLEKQAERTKLLEYEARRWFSLSSHRLFGQPDLPTIKASAQVLRPEQGEQAWVQQLQELRLAICKGDDRQINDMLQKCTAETGQKFFSCDRQSGVARALLLQPSSAAAHGMLQTLALGNEVGHKEWQGSRKLPALGFYTWDQQELPADLEPSWLAVTITNTMAAVESLPPPAVTVPVGSQPVRSSQIDQLANCIAKKKPAALQVEHGEAAASAALQALQALASKAPKSKYKMWVYASFQPSDSAASDKKAKKAAGGSKADKGGAVPAGAATADSAARGLTLYCLVAQPREFDELHKVPQLPDGHRRVMQGIVEEELHRLASAGVLKDMQQTVEKFIMDTKAEKKKQAAAALDLKKSVRYHLNQAIQELQRSLAASQPMSILLQKQASPGPPAIKGDKQAVLEQVLAPGVHGSSQALPGSSSGADEEAEHEAAATGASTGSQTGSSLHFTAQEMAAMANEPLRELPPEQRVALKSLVRPTRPLAPEEKRLLLLQLEAGGASPAMSSDEREMRDEIIRDMAAHGYLSGNKMGLTLQELKGLSLLQVAAVAAILHSADKTEEQPASVRGAPTAPAQAEPGRSSVQGAVSEGRGNTDAAAAKDAEERARKTRQNLMLATGMSAEDIENALREEHASGAARR